MADEKKVTEDKKLPFDKLFPETGDDLVIFVGVITEMGLIKRYKEDVKKYQKGKAIKPVASLKEYNEVREQFLNKEI